MNRSPTMRWLLRVAAAAAAAGCILLALLWWQDRGLDAAEDRLTAGDAAAALAMIDELLAERPDDTRALALRGRALVGLGRPDEAVRLFEQAGAAQVKDLRAWSTALVLLGRRDEALPILERILQLEPGDADTLELAAMCQLELGRRHEAIEAAQRLSKLPGREAIGHFHLALVYWEWGYPSIANEHFARVLEARPGAKDLPVEPARFLLAYCDSLLAAGNARAALEVLQQTSDTKSGAEVAVRQGAAWLVIGDEEQAKEGFQRGLRENPDSLAAREGLAEVALQQGDAGAAIKWLRPLVDAARVSADSAYLLQRAYTQLGDDSQAQQWQAKSVELRTARRRLAALLAEARNNPQSPRSGLIAAYQAALDQDWDAARGALAALLRQAPLLYDEPFVQQLIEAVRQRSAPPALESLPDY